MGIMLRCRLTLWIKDVAEEMLVCLMCADEVNVQWDGMG
jgi:hypothetical protein